VLYSVMSTERSLQYQRPVSLCELGDCEEELNSLAAEQRRPIRRCEVLTLGVFVFSEMISTYMYQWISGCYCNTLEGMSLPMTPRSDHLP
jgi:hypothetical protein